jgi:Zn-dependent peptidase ImmA (M78 family)
MSRTGRIAANDQRRLSLADRMEYEANYFAMCLLIPEFWLKENFPKGHLQDGIDIRTLQQWMGHRDIASTMVYLKGVRNSDIQVRLNKGSLAAFA